MLLWTISFLNRILKFDIKRNRCLLERDFLFLFIKDYIFGTFRSVDLNMFWSCTEIVQLTSEYSKMGENWGKRLRCVESWCLFSVWKLFEIKNNIFQTLTFLCRNEILEDFALLTSNHFKTENAVVILLE